MSSKLCLWLIWGELSGFRWECSVKTLPFALVTTWKGDHKCRENRESGPFRCTQPEAMRTAWFQRHTRVAKHGTGRYGSRWNRTHLMLPRAWGGGGSSSHIFRVWPSFPSTGGREASSQLCFSGWFQGSLMLRVGQVSPWALASTNCEAFSDHQEKESLGFGF